MLDRLLKNYCGEPATALLGARFLAYLQGMSRSLRAMRLAPGCPRDVFQWPVVRLLKIYCGEPAAALLGARSIVPNGAGASILLLALLVGGLSLAAGEARAAASPAPVRSANADPEAVTLNFVNADIESAVRAIGQFLRRDVLVDPRVKGTLTIVTEQPVRRQEAWRLLLAALRFQGYAAVDSGGMVRVLPEADARFLGGPTLVEPSQIGSDQLVTQIFRLNHESANTLVPILRPLITANNPISVNPGNNTLVITDYAENLRRIGRIIAAVDLPNASEVEVLPLQHALAVDLAPVISRLLEPAATAASDPGQRVVVLSEPRSNSLLIRAASPARLALGRSLVARLDTPSAASGNIHIVSLRNADATRLAQTLRSVIGGESLPAGNPSSVSLSSGGQSGGSMTQTGTMGASGGTAVNSGASNLAGQAGNQAATSGLALAGAQATVQADSATNSLIITAPEPIYRNLRSVIELLDARRAQVFIESLIVEVTASRAAEFGVQWMDLSGVQRPGVQVIGGTNFGNSSQNIISGAQDLSNLGPGLNIGVVRGSINIPGIGAITNLGVLARALESDSNTNILSTPNLLTLDNEEARIIVGENVPFITGQYAQTGSTATVTPFQTIERRDVGLTLRVRPQVSEGGTVKLQIYQEVSSIDARVLQGGVVTNKRALESSVLVDDGQIIVLGGLIQDSVTTGQEKVPLLGDLPVLGNLFRYETRQRTKTNLMVFLRPYVIRGAQAGHLVVDRYDLMRREGLGAQPPPSWILPDMPAPVLPTLDNYERR